MNTNEQPLIKIEDLSVEFRTQNGTTAAVSSVNMSIYPRQTLAVVGESGCGKSVTAMTTLGLIPQPPGRVTNGSITFDNQNVLDFNDKQMRALRGNDIAMIFQEPMTSLNPVYTIGWQILEAIHLHRKVTQAQAIDIAADALREVGIAEPRRRLNEYPHQLSGGMRQRVMIAMALACQPPPAPRRRTHHRSRRHHPGPDPRAPPRPAKPPRHVHHAHHPRPRRRRRERRRRRRHVRRPRRRIRLRPRHLQQPHAPLHARPARLRPRPRKNPRPTPHRHEPNPRRLRTTLRLHLHPPSFAPRQPREHYPILSTMDDAADTPMGLFLADTALAGPSSTRSPTNTGSPAGPRTNPPPPHNSHDPTSPTDANPSPHKRDSPGTNLAQSTPQHDDRTTRDRRTRHRRAPTRPHPTRQALPPRTAHTLPPALPRHRITLLDRPARPPRLALVVCRTRRHPRVRSVHRPLLVRPQPPPTRRRFTQNPHRQHPNQQHPAPPHPRTHRSRATPTSCS